MDAPTGAGLWQGTVTHPEQLKAGGSATRGDLCEAVPKEWAMELCWESFSISEAQRGSVQEGWHPMRGTSHGTGAV